MASLVLLLLVVLVGSNNAGQVVEAVNQDGVHLLEAKRLLTDPSGALADWNPRDATPCGWTGVSCDDDGAVTGISLPNANLAGPFPASALCRLPRLRSINLNANYISGLSSPSAAGGDVGGCKALRHLDLSMNELVGPLPDALADELPELVYLDLSSNNFSGAIPPSFGRFPKLQSLGLVYNLLEGTIPPFLGNVSTLRELNLSYNPFVPGPVPAELGNLTALRVLWLAGCNLVGGVPPSLGRLANLTDLDLSTNSLTGRIPPEIWNLRSATQILLYNNSLSGPIPIPPVPVPVPQQKQQQLQDLRSIDLAMNRLDGAIPEDLFLLAPNLETVHLYGNQLTGPVPESAAKATSLAELRLFQNRLNGTLPADLGKNSPLVCVDISDNAISGEIPTGICDRGELQELLMLDNQLSGRLPDSLGRCRSLSRVRLSNNRLNGDVPAAFWGLPHVSLLELDDNLLTGEISPSIAGAANLSKLVLSNNRLTGRIPSEIGSASKLYELSADGNMLSGPLPASLGGLPELGRLVLRNNSLSGQMLRGIQHSWKKLSELNLAHNGFTGSIPAELGELPVLNYLDLSGNKLSGEIPVELENLKLNQFNVSDNDLSGPVPPQLLAAYPSTSFIGNPKLDSSSDQSHQQEQERRKKQQHLMLVWAIFVLAAVILVAGVAWFCCRYHHQTQSFSSSDMDKSKNKKWTVTSFHKLGFSEYEILGCLDEDNVIGSGASGKVYKAVLSNGEVVAVKKLFSSAAVGVGGGGASESNKSSSDVLFDAEVRTLGKIRHKNIVKLWCCCARTHGDCKLLVYEYMPNGSLGDALHGNSTEKESKKLLLDWPTRYKIALDAAEGLSYLHHDCVPAIVHRDVKSNNILLDADFGARVADFGVAKTVVVKDGNSNKPTDNMSVIAGSCGYIAPEYAYTLRVNEKSDTYSFGVVLLELVTGKPPVGHPDFGETKDLVKWVSSTITDQDGLERVLDTRLLSLPTDTLSGGDSDSTAVMMDQRKEEMIRVLQIGLLCTSSLPINRPPMRRVVKMLQEVRLFSVSVAAADNNNDTGKLSSPYYYCYYEDTTSTDQGSTV